MQDKIAALNNPQGSRFKIFWNKYKTSKIMWGVLIIIVVGVILIATHKNTTTNITAVATTGNVIDSVSVSGRTQSASAVSLGFADQGRIATVSVSEGDHVHAGDVLATLDTSDLNASLENAQAALTIAKAGVSTNTTNLDQVTRQQNTLVDNAYRALLSGSLQAVPDDVNTSSPAPTITGNYTGDKGVYHIHIYPSGTNLGTSFDVSGLETSYSNPVTPNTTVPLGTHGLYIQFGNNATYGNTWWTVSIPNQRSSAYTTNYNAYLSAQAARDQAISSAQSQLVQSGTDNSIAEAQIEQAQAQVDGIISQINKRKIIAPFDGVVANVDIKPGQITSSLNATATPNGITLISENDYQVVLNVPEINVAKLSVGQAADITLDAYGKDAHFPGKIISIDPAETIVSGVPVYETKVTFTQPDVRIRSGMTATATIVASEHDNVVFIPANFVQSNADGSSFVYLLGKDGKTKIQSVTTGLRGSDSSVEIVSGLSAHETVSSSALK